MTTGRGPAGEREQSARMKGPARGYGRSIVGALAVLAAVAITGPVAPASAATVSGWPAYLHGPMHSSYSPAETAISPASASRLNEDWRGPQGYYLSSPVVADGAVFVASYTGWFYKLSQVTGAVLGRVYLGYEPKKTCVALGMVDTATVTADPVNHQDTVYVAGADGYLYAFNAANLSLKWKSVIAIPSTKTSDYFDWASPTVANGKIYIGVASGCDDPLIRGGVISYDQATGKKLAEFYTVPKGTVGGSVWSSVAVGPGGYVYATTGNGPADAQRLSYSESIIKLAPGTLKPLGYYQLPASQLVTDSDFGGSPTIFGRYVGACNKNGLYYAVNQLTMTLAWKTRIGAGTGGCLAAAAYNGKHLYIGGPAATIDGKYYRGSVQERDPSDGLLQWATGLPNAVLGSASLDGSGVVAVGTYDKSKTPDATYLINATTGKVIRALIEGTDFAQSAFAGGRLFTANSTGVYAWGLAPAAAAARAATG